MEVTITGATGREVRIDGDVTWCDITSGDVVYTCGDMEYTLTQTVYVPRWRERKGTARQRHLGRQRAMQRIRKIERAQRRTEEELMAQREHHVNQGMEIQRHGNTWR